MTIRAGLCCLIVCFQSMVTANELLREEAKGIDIPDAKAFEVLLDRLSARITDDYAESIQHVRREMVLDEAASASFAEKLMRYRDDIRLGKKKEIQRTCLTLTGAERAEMIAEFDLLQYRMDKYANEPFQDFLASLNGGEKDKFMDWLRHSKRGLTVSKIEPSVMFRAAGDKAEILDFICRMPV